MRDQVPRDRPKLIITCGLMGTGKTTIARKLAKMNGWALISSDAVRKELAGMPTNHHEYVAWGKGIYSSDFSEKTYARMNEIAEELLKEGKSVVADACYRKKSERANVYALARAMNAEFTCIELVCPEKEIKRRLTVRMNKRGEISDGRWAIFSDQKASFEKIDDFAREEHIIVDTSKPRNESLKQAMHEMKLRNRRTETSSFKDPTSD